MNFNPRSREGSDFHQSSFNIYIFNFNPRSREGSDLSNFIPNVFFINFNPRSREGSDATIPTNCNRYDRISIHAPAKGATHPRPSPSIISLIFQSTLPRRERRQTLSSVRCSPQISIHAPAKGATKEDCDFHRAIKISIHAPAKGATTLSVMIVQWMQFQSTLPRRERLPRHRMM